MHQSRISDCPYQAAPYRDAEWSNIDLPEFLEIVGSLMDEIKFLHPEKYKEIMGKIRNAKHF